MKFPGRIAAMETVAIWLLVALLVLIAFWLSACSAATPTRPELRAEAVRSAADSAAIAAAELRARIAGGTATKAEADAAEARANALARQAESAEQRAIADREKRAKEDAELRAANAAIAAQEARDNLGWWFAAAGGIALGLAVGLAAFGVYVGIAPKALGAAAALAAAGIVSLALGAAWSWVPIVGGILLVIILLVVVAKLLLAIRHQSAAGSILERIDPVDQARMDEIKRSLSADQIKDGVHDVVGWLRGKSREDTRKALAGLERRSGFRKAAQ